MHGNYLAPSIRAAGLDPDNLPVSDPSKMSFGGGEGSKQKAWKDIWGAGQSVGAIHAIEPAAAVVARLRREYQEATASMPGARALLRAAGAGPQPSPGEDEPMAGRSLEAPDRAGVSPSMTQERSPMP